jgi:hypothetical protein
MQERKSKALNNSQSSIANSQSSIANHQSAIPNPKSEISPATRAFSASALTE